MKLANEKVIEKNGYKLHLIHTKKFKTVHVNLKFKAPLDRSTVTKRALLPYVLQQGTNNYSSARDLRLALDSLYGAVLQIDASKKGNSHLLNFRLELANSKFIEGNQQLLQAGLALLAEVIYNPKVENNQFSDKVVNREKQTLLDKMDAIKDEKMSYANLRLIDEMCKDEAFSIHAHGYEEDLDEIDGKLLFETLQSLLKDDQLDVYVVGDIEGLDIEKKIGEYLKREKTSPLEIEFAEVKPRKMQEIKEEQKIQQAKLHLGFRTFVSFGDTNYAALQVFNGLFGGFPSSKLFLNVREKHSLAYYAASRIESHVGLLFVFSGIAPEQYDRAKTIILEQVEDMKKGEFTEKELDQTKEMIINQIKETMDNPQGIIELHYQQVIADTEKSPSALMEDINSVSYDDIVSVANQLHLDTIYVLTSEGGSGNGA